MSVGPVKRVTLWVRDAERSLAVYRDALGLCVIEDKLLSGAAIARMVGLQQASLRIVHLAAPGTDYGWVGLYEVRDALPPLAALPDPAGFPRFGQATVLLTTDSMTEVVARLRVTSGVQLITEPTEYRKTTPADATPAGRYSECLFFDPDRIPVGLMGYATL